MKLFRIALVVLVVLVNLLVALPSWADSLPNLNTNLDVGQRVVWLYKARAGSGYAQRVPAEVVKLGSKRVQIKVHKHNSEFVTRWVNRDKLEVAKS